MRVLVATELDGPGIVQQLLGDKHELIFAANVAEASALILKHRFDLVLCDILFDDSGVFNLLMSIRKDINLAKLPFVCCQLQESGMPPSLVSSFEIVCVERGDCLFLDVLDLTKNNRHAEVSAVLEKYASQHGFGTPQSESVSNNSY